MGAASGRNRLVVEFTTAVPAYELTLNPDGTRFAMTGSGEGVTLAGSSGIALHIRDLDWANDRYASGRDLTPRYTTLQEVRVVGDFEGQADIAIGVSAALCPTVTELAGPPRLVVDFPAA